MKTDIPHAKALRIAVAIVDELAEACERIEIAGSIRREKATCGDIEIVVIPRTERSGLFGDVVLSLLDEQLGSLVDAGRFRRIKGGDRYRQYEIIKAAPLCLDLYIVTAERWGQTMLIRTGPAALGKAIVTPQCKQGLLPDHLDLRDGRVWPVDRDTQTGEVLSRGVALHTPEERDVFAAIGLDWIEPKQRDVWIDSRPALRGRPITVPGADGNPKTLHTIRNHPHADHL